MAYNIRRERQTFGEHFRAWRMIQRLTAEQVAERAEVSLLTLRKLERGDTSVRLESALQVARALGILDRIIDSSDPLATDLGRARADQISRRRVR